MQAMVVCTTDVVRLRVLLGHLVAFVDDLVVVAADVATTPSVADDYIGTTVGGKHTFEHNVACRVT